jgi:type III secretory pathway component EscR
MIRQFRRFSMAAIALLLVVTVVLGSLFSAPLAAIADDYSQNQQASQSAYEQSPYDQDQGADSYTSDYTDQQTNQTDVQTQQSNQAGANEQQYEQQQQTYPAQ